MSVYWAGDGSTELTRNDGTNGLPIGALVALGNFGTMTDSQILLLGSNPIAVWAAFSPWATGHIGDSTFAAATFREHSTASGAGFFSEPAYLVAFDASTAASSTQVGVFKGSVNAWVFPADDAGYCWMILEDVGSGGVIIGSYGTLTYNSPYLGTWVNALELSQGQTNSWINPGSHYWEEPANWSFGLAPSGDQSGILITNANSKIVLLDILTSYATNSLTINHLGVWAPFGITNTLIVNMETLTAPLHVLNGLVLRSGGSLLVWDSTLQVDGIFGGTFSIDGAMQMNSGAVITTGAVMVVGNIGAGTAIVNDGNLLANDLSVGKMSGSQGTMTIAGGSVSVANHLLVGGNGTGTVLVGNGQLVATNNLTAVGFLGVGQMTISNGTALAGDLAVGCYTQGVSTAANALSVAGGQLVTSGDYTMIGCSGVGQMTVVGGTVNLNSLLSIGIDKGTGAVWVAGGQLAVTNGDTFVGCSGSGQIIVSNGTVHANAVYVGDDPFAISDLFYTNAPVSQMVSGGISEGTLTAAGGTVMVHSNLVIGAYVGATGMVWATGGQIIATNDTTAIGYSGIGRMTVSNGTVETLGMFVGQIGDSQGTLTIAGGTLVSWGDVVVGDCATNATGQVVLDGGNMFVIKASHNAVLEVRQGTLTLNSGLLFVDTLVITNPCAQIVRNGGWLIYDNLVLDPNSDNDGDGMPNGWEQSHGLDPLNPADANVDTDGDGFSNLQEFQAGTDPTHSTSALRIIELAPEDDDMLISWTAVGGKRYVLQTTTGDSGSFSNNFVDLNPAIVAPGTGETVVTVLHLGAVTNTPARFYRVRLLVSP